MVAAVACTGTTAPDPMATATPGVGTAAASPSPSPGEPSARSPSPEPSPGEPSTPSPSPEPSPTAPTTRVALAVESRVADHATDDLRARVEAILTDPRGWVRAGFTFVFDDTRAPYRLVLAEPDEVDDLCRPMDTHGMYSCQNGPLVALNADRWRTATSSWTGTLDEYRTMLVNHEVGHLLHLHHPQPQCAALGLPAPVMAQQSSELGACVANPWPLQWEVDLAARRAEPLAPPPEHDVRDHQPSPPAATS